MREISSLLWFSKPSADVLSTRLGLEQPQGHPKLCQLLMPPKESSAWSSHSPLLAIASRQELLWEVVLQPQQEWSGPWIWDYALHFLVLKLFFGECWISGSSPAMRELIWWMKGILNVVILELSQNTNFNFFWNELKNVDMILLENIAGYHFRTVIRRGFSLLISDTSFTMFLAHSIT